MLKKYFKYLRDQYILNQVSHVRIPDFPPDRICRYRVTFSGRVQNVGFRMEASELAGKLELTGFCENLLSGDVLAEFQGPENRIFFLIGFMESLKRIVIEDKVMEEIPLRDGDHGFGYR